MLSGMRAASTSSPVATAVMARLVPAFRGAADPSSAGPMRAYMRDQFPYLGLRAPRQRALGRAVLTGLDPPREADLRAVALHCWELPEREFQYFACDWLRRHAGSCSARFIDTAQHLITTKPWWDTVDTLAAHVVGSLVSRHPTLLSTMDEWAVGGDLWLARTAILHQLTYRGDTDATRLFGYCAAQARHPDFFIRKAIGWALREYAKTDPDAVHAFVDAHRAQLSGLSTREALKHLVSRSGRD
jgi:3-methyladenine DNA glycosylase AlkD